MFRFRNHKKPDKQAVEQSVNEKERAPVSATTDPYLINIVRLLEKLRTVKKH